MKYLEPALRRPGPGERPSGDDLIPTLLVRVTGARTVTLCVAASVPVCLASGHQAGCHGPPRPRDDWPSAGPRRRGSLGGHPGPWH